MTCLNFCLALMTSLEQAQEHLTLSFKEYKAAHINDYCWRDEYLELLSHACAEAYSTLVDAELKQAHNIRQQKKSTTNMKHMRGKLLRTPTTQIYYIVLAGFTIVCSNKLSM